MAGLTAQPLGPQGGFNWVFLVELLVCVIVAIFFLFYFNRLFATAVSYAIRAFTWHYYRAYIDITSLQISLLGGRLFFKRIRYHAHNETILVHHGQITWRYWLRNVQDAEIFLGEDEEVRTKTKHSSSGSDAGSAQENREEGTKETSTRSASADKAERATNKPKKELPCRISVKVSGVEAFIYNRSPVYDGIVEATNNMAQSPPNSAGKDEAPKSPKTPQSMPDEQSASSDTRRSPRMGHTFEKSMTQSTAQLSSMFKNLGQDKYQKPNIPSWLRMLPVRVECKKAAAAVGNENTTSIIVARLENAGGTIDAGAAGPLDYYKLLFNFEFKQVKVDMKPNRDFKQYRLDAAREILRTKVMAPKLEKKRTQFPAPIFAPYLQRFGSWLPAFRHQGSGGSLRTTSIGSEAVIDEKAIIDNELPGEAQWHGLSRYLDDGERNEHDEWQPIEYAKASTLVDCEKVGMRFYWDIPGTMPEAVAEEANLTKGTHQAPYADDMNLSRPPDYGLDFFVYGGVVVYGPWADRQRINLQQSFFPQGYVDATPSPSLHPGQTRVCTEFKIFVSVEEDITLRIPLRESSKDHEWQGRADSNRLSGRRKDVPVGKHGKRSKHTKRNKSKKQGTTPGADVRPFAWLDITVKRDSTVNYVMDMFARCNGYNNRLDLDVKGTEIMSSVNHGLLWRAGHLTMFADLSNPLTWNTLRTWPFKIVCDDLELFILRDHMFQITDLVNDWSSGPPPDFYTFVPYKYEMDVSFRNFCMFINVNDGNVIDEPDSLDRNSFLTIEGRNLHGLLSIPLEFYRPKKSGVTFDVLSEDMRMRFLCPIRSTYRNLVKDKLVAELPRLTLKGSYEANAESAPGLTDVLRMDLVGTGLSLKAYGFLMRYFINVKQNYFGDYLHFKTLEEFQSASANLLEANALTVSTQPTPANELDVILCIQAVDATVMAPTTLYSIDEFVKVDLPQGNIDLRITSYYMDLVLNFSPVSILSGSKQTENPESPVESASSTQLHIASVDLLGHRLFGLAPGEPAYVNDWEVDVGAITGECNSDFIKDLAFTARSFIFTFADGENIWPIGDPYIIYDIVFLQLRTDILKIWVHVGNEALLLSTQPVSVDFNDRAGDLFSQHVSVLVPDLTFACVDAKSASRHRVRGSRKQPVRTYAFLQTSVEMSMVGRKLNFSEERGLQQAHLKKHDQRTRRAMFLQLRRNMRATLDLDPDVDPPNIPYPDLPPPINDYGQTTGRPSSVKSVNSIASVHRLSSKSSKSSLSQSIRGGALAVPFQHVGRSDASSSSVRNHSRASSSKSSAGLHSDLPDDDERAAFGLPPSTMAFSSTYADPYFPLDTIRPDESNVPSFGQLTDADLDDQSDIASLSGAINDGELDESSEHITIFLKLVPGIRGYFEPKIAETAASLLTLLQPKDPETVLDAFQVNVMDTISAKLASRHRTGKMVEVHANVPSAKIRVANPFDDSRKSDQIDLELRSLQFMLRIRSQPAASRNPDGLAMHVTLGSLFTSLREMSRIAPSKPVIEASIDDALVWVTLAGAQALHVSTRDISFKATSSQAEYVATLVLRVLTMIKELEPKFKKPLEAEQNRLRILVFALTRYGEEIGDPNYMGKLIYILRAFPDHFRNQESWKVLSRFRRILQSLPSDVISVMQEQFRSEDIDRPEANPAGISEAWAEWRNWDVPNIRKTMVFEMLLGSDDETLFKNVKSQQLAVTWRTERLDLAVDHDPKAFEIVIEDVSVGLDMTPPSMPTGLMLVEDNKRTKTLLQVHSSTIAFGFDWSICGIVESLLARKESFAKLIERDAKHEPRSKSQALSDELDRHDFHVVASNDVGTITLTSANLRHKSSAEGMRLSLIGTTQSPDENFGQCACVLLNADSAVTELYGQDRCIWYTLLTLPSVYLDHINPPEHVGVPLSLTVAMAYKELQINVKDQIPGILNTIDLVIVNEVKTVKRLIDLGLPETPQSSPHSSSKDDIPTRPASARPKVNVALLAGPFQLDVSLLSNLSYHLLSKSTSLRVAPNLTVPNTFGIDFDVAEQNHGFINTSGNIKQEQGLLVVPPINGHVGLQLRNDATELSVLTTVQEISVDASAISGLMSVVNKPEVTEVFKEVKACIGQIQNHVKELDDGKKRKEEAVESSQNPLIFEARAALLGLRIGAITPHIPHRADAELQLGFGPLYVAASNKPISLGDGHTQVLDVRAQIKDVGVNLAVCEKGASDKRHPCGNVIMGGALHFNARKDQNDKLVRELIVRTPSVEVNAFPETASTAIDVINHMQDRIRDLDLSREVEYLRHLRHSSRTKKAIPTITTPSTEAAAAAETAGFSAADLLSISVTLEVTNIQVCWLVAQSYAVKQGVGVQDPVFSIARIELTAKGGNEAKLTISDILLQLVPKRQSKQQRYLNSALLPQVSFSVGYWSSGKDKSFAFKATGKPLDLRLETRFMLPVSAVQKSVETAIEQFRAGTATWQNTPTTTGAPRAKLFGESRLASLLVEVDFAGARVYLQGIGQPSSRLSVAAASAQVHGAQHGRYGQFAGEGEPMSTALVAPGIALKVQYDDRDSRPVMNGELMVEASENSLLPNVVPLVLQISSSVKEVLRAEEKTTKKRAQTPPEEKKAQPRFSEDAIVNADPEALFGKTRINLGLRICRQQFGLTCQPIARVDAKAELEDFYFTMNTIDSDDHGRFFALSAVMTGLKAQIKHMYSREPTFSFEIVSIVLSLMNSKHLSGVNGISAILKINPTKTMINAKQLQDLLVFREIWLPPEIRNARGAAPAQPSQAADDYLMQRYQNMSAAAAFPWNVTVSIAELAIDLDLGQSIGKSSFNINDLWASSQKSSSWEQNLCIGLGEMAVKSVGRMSGFISLGQLGARTMIKWPEGLNATKRNPLIQASIGFQRLRAKASFDYQAFAFVDIEEFDFLMYNVREAQGAGKDRLVAILDGSKTYAFMTSTSPAQALGLFQAFERLFDEKERAYKQSLRDMEKHVRRESIVVPTRYGPEVPNSPVKSRSADKASISLHTDVVVTLGSICVGAFPSTFFDSQILKLEATNIQARFAVGMERRRIHSGLGMTLGQLLVALASVKKVAVPKTLGDISIDDVISSAVNSKGGIILRVPRVVASMQTWQTPDTINIDYLFRSLFDGKIDVGWNLSRINFIKGMWVAGSKALASRLGGKQLPQSAVKISAAPQKDKDTEEDGGEGAAAGKRKITAEVNLPMSKYEYHALEPPIIETPQLRDMGEATPPLEWIGLHRDRLPNVTHQIIIVSLLEVAKEVEDAYERILGSS